MSHSIAVRKHHLLNNLHESLHASESSSGGKPDKSRGDMCRRGVPMERDEVFATYLHPCCGPESPNGMGSQGQGEHQSQIDPCFFVPVVALTNATTNPICLCLTTILTIPKEHSIFCWKVTRSRGKGVTFLTLVTMGQHQAAGEDYCTSITYCCDDGIVYTVTQTQSGEINSRTPTFPFLLMVKAKLM